MGLFSNSGIRIAGRPGFGADLVSRQCPVSGEAVQNYARLLQAMHEPSLFELAHQNLGRSRLIDCFGCVGTVGRLPSDLHSAWCGRIAFVFPISASWREGAPQENVITTPPELCIEILSPEDTLTKIVDRVSIFAMGVPIVDPVGRSSGCESGAVEQRSTECSAPQVLKCRWRQFLE